MTQPEFKTSKLVVYRTSLIAAGVVAVGVLLLYVAGRGDWFVHKAGLQTLLNALAALLITTGGLAVLWDLRGKRDVIDIILDKAQVSADVRASGIQRVSMDWLSVPWDQLFNSSKQIEIFISYGSSFRKVHWEKLQSFVSKPGNLLYIYLPDPDDETSVRVLAQRYSYAVERIQTSILETTRDMAKLAKDGAADLRVYYRKGDPAFTCYRFDDTFVVTLYSHRRERGSIPTFIVQGGSFREFLATDMEAIKRQSEEVSLAAVEDGGVG